MFRQIALRNGTFQQVIRAHPARLAAALEAYWHRINIPAGNIAPPDPNFPYGIESIASVSAGWSALAPTLPVNPAIPQPAPPIAWDHLIYAYMIENTRVFEIFERVIRTFCHGERFGVPTPATQAWLRATEELLYRPGAPFAIGALTSDIRPDGRAGRRNAYYRMFGLDLNHGGADNKPYTFEKPDAANRDFVSTLERLLNEVWRGIVNSQNTSGKRDTDDEAIHTLCERLRDMLTLRRRLGILNREEFWYTSTMSWLHMALEQDTPIIQDLEAQATAPEDRLAKVGNRVGMPAHGRSRSFLILADTLSQFLITIEVGGFATLAQAQTLYTVPATRALMQEIITHYSVATGRDIKASAIAVTESRR
ncbi:hypothetical protein GPL17_33215 [Bradyrhizobium yuanmingense]|uniref:hypothetical protein n=1 Tax=Bradyrhizobium yuanmingense TaxID=108015 RepID=UPI0012F75FCA|nr:hypothetical protein [Bradyrhizobium yuanmingense]MVT55294.1 hypothetical protein [Bradyrhizobium yuanmingense]